MVVDGMMVGHPCCSVFNCMIPLDNNCHHFCPTHQPHHKKLCSIVGCEQPVIRGQPTCNKSEHQHIEDIHRLHGQSHFQLQERLKHACISHPQSTNALDANVTEFLDRPKEVFKVDQDGNMHPTTMITHTEGPRTGLGGKGGDSTRKKRYLCAQFGCCRTFCQEIMVAPCGMIGYHTTYYGAEGVASVAVSLDTCIASSTDVQTWTDAS